MKIILFAMVTACGSSGSSDCASNQIQVTYFKGAQDGQSACKPIPVSCDGIASCDGQSCIRDMYALCDAPYIGVGCSDTFPPTIISCNP